MSKRGPSVLGTDLRDRRPTLPRAGSSRPGTSPAAARSPRTTVDGVLQFSSDIPSAQPRFPGGIRPRRHSNAGLPNLASRMTGQQNVPSRTTKISEKLVIIPSADEDVNISARNHQALEDRLRLEVEQSERNEEWIGDPSRGETWAERLGKAHRKDKLARVTAYCTAQSMKMKATAEFLKNCHEARTKLYDDCLYVVYHTPLLQGSDGTRVRSRPVLMHPGSKKSILDLMIERGERRDHYDSDLEAYSTSPELVLNGGSRQSTRQYSEDDLPQIDTQRRTITNLLLPEVSEYAEMFVFSYGVVVFWNFSEGQEKDILADLTFAEIDEPQNGKIGTNDKLAPNSSTASGEKTSKSSLMTRPLSDTDVETEEFHFQYSEDVKKPRVFNDMITLMPRSDHMVKLTISHAIAQSTKLCYFEEKMTETLNACQAVPKTLAKTGELKMGRTEVLKMMGRLYKNRVDINLSSNVLDVPNFFWDSEPVLQPLYGAIREYLEIDSRVDTLNAKSAVFLDLATMLSDSVADTKMSNITIIIIVLIVISIFVSITETTMRFNILQKDKKSHNGEESDPVPGDDNAIAPFSGSGSQVRIAAYQQLESMTPDQTVAWVENLTAQDKMDLCGDDILCRALAGI